MAHNDAINNKQASWEACKLFWPKLAQATKHTKLCRNSSWGKAWGWSKSFAHEDDSDLLQPKSSSVCVKLIVARPCRRRRIRIRTPPATRAQLQPYLSQNKAIAYTRSVWSWSKD